MIRLINNKSVRVLLRNLLILSLLCIIGGLLVPPLVVFFIFILIGFYLFLKYEISRQEDILDLTMYLKRLNHLDYNYELKDFSEGDLSLLKSEIHKTMYLLQNFNVQLQNQRDFIYTSLSDISHQLKTPIAGIQLMLDLNEGEITDSEQFIHMQTQVERLQSLVERLLVHIQLEAKSIEMHKENVDSNKLIDDLLKMIHTDVNIKCDVQNFVFSIDLKWTLEALFNVVNNKLRYANEDITIKVYRNKLYHIIEISDDGPSISLKDRDHLFDRFYKGENSDANSIGIGLAITKEIMELQNGKVVIENENTFKFMFDDNTVIL